MTTAEADPRAAAKGRIADAIRARRDDLLALSHRIHANPEPAFGERQASGWVAEVLRAAGFEVQHPAGSLETAIVARMPGGRGLAGPRIGILAEYDALPGLGHGCGHNTMAASGVGAALGLAAVAGELAGEIVFLGTPAEERGSGKQFMIDDGLFDGIDAALLYHPSDMTFVEAMLMACDDIDVVFTGVEAHAAGEPWRGRNALDAMVMLLNSIGLWRQQLKPDARVHGIVLEGGTAANIIPARSVGRFMVRSTDQVDFEAMERRFAELVEAAAAATGCESEIVFSGRSSTMRHNKVLGERFAANLVANGFIEDPPDELLGSSDMGNVSHTLPTIHPALAICERGMPMHSVDFREAAISPRADDVVIASATIVAQTAYDLFADPSLVTAAWDEFRRAS